LPKSLRMRFFSVYEYAISSSYLVKQVNNFHLFLKALKGSTRKSSATFRKLCFWNNENCQCK